jgi:hypothetical protein
MSSSQKVELKLDWCSHEAAKYAVEHWHYSRRMPKFKQVYIGVWEDEKYIGCVIFGLSVTPYLGDAFGLSNIECAELTRIALTRHRSPVSKIGAFALKMIKKQSSGLRLIVSYADPSQNHNGVIYQAMNWVYCGTSSAVRQYFYKGDWRNDSPMFREFARIPILRKTTEYRDLEPKLKYLMPLDEEMRKRIEPLRKPYPKRATSETNDTLAIHAGKGGAAPTVALHI